MKCINNSSTTIQLTESIKTSASQKQLSHLWIWYFESTTFSCFV